MRLTLRKHPLPWLARKWWSPRPELGDHQLPDTRTRQHRKDEPSGAHETYEDSGVTIRIDSAYPCELPVVLPGWADRGSRKIQRMTRLGRLEGVPDSTASST